MSAFNQGDGKCIEKMVQRGACWLTTKKKVVEYHHFIVNVLGQESSSHKSQGLREICRHRRSGDLWRWSSVETLNLDFVMSISSCEEKKQTSSWRCVINLSGSSMIHKSRLGWKSFDMMREGEGALGRSERPVDKNTYLFSVKGLRAQIRVKVVKDDYVLECSREI